MISAPEDAISSQERRWIERPVVPNNRPIVVAGCVSAFFRATNVVDPIRRVCDDRIHLAKRRHDFEAIALI
jgi:hypothetical protein